VGTRAGDVRETPVVGLEGLSPDDIRDSQVKFVEIVLEGVTESVKSSEVAASPLVEAESVEDDPGDALNGVKLLMCTVPPFVLLVMISKRVGVGIGEIVWFA